MADHLEMLNKDCWRSDSMCQHYLRLAVNDEIFWKQMFLLLHRLDFEKKRLTQGILMVVIILEVTSGYQS